MKILVLGAGAIGGYFGGRLVQAGADVVFLVHERRARQLRDNGLVVRSPHGDFTVPVRSVLRSQLEVPFDLVVLTCKAYDLEAAIEAIEPAVGASTCVLPLLNGVAHIERLIAAFGAARVAGGSCAIPATLTADGEVMQLGLFHSIVFGRLPGTSADAARRGLARSTRRPCPVEPATIRPALGRSRRPQDVAGDDLPDARGRRDPGHRRRSGRSAEAPRRRRERPSRARHRVPPRSSDSAVLTDRASTLTASMLRDLESGGRTEGAHSVGDMLRRAEAAGIDPGPLRAAWCHLQAAEEIRARKAAQAPAD
jgi:2-dehydropantoate 2-reductase